MHTILKMSTTTLLVPTIFLVIIFIMFMLKIAKDENRAITLVRYIAIVAIGIAIILFLFWVAGIREKYGN